MSFEKRATLAIEKLAKRRRITVHWRDDTDGEAHAGTRQIWTPRPRTQYLYMVSLHEMGHILSTHSVAAYRRGDLLTCEAAAWEWAMMEGADPELVETLTPTTRNTIRACWGTYLPDELS